MGTPEAKTIQLDSKQASELLECLERLDIIEKIEFQYTNNIKRDSYINREKRASLERAINIIRPSAAQLKSGKMI
jgi:hypothetical protein